VPAWTGSSLELLENSGKQLTPQQELAAARKFAVNVSRNRPVLLACRLACAVCAVCDTAAIGNSLGFLLPAALKPVPYLESFGTLSGSHLDRIHQAGRAAIVITITLSPFPGNVAVAKAAAYLYNAVVERDSISATVDECKSSFGTCSMNH
jgi:hypothetical protein